MPVITKDHPVPHKSTVPANKDEMVNLFVREKYDTSPGQNPERKVVLMLHGRSVPVLAGFDLQHASYSWAEALAKAGHDVFMMDLQGSGRSPRPRMDDPRNCSQANQALVKPRPPGFTPGPATYAFQLNNSDSDQAELHTVVEWIRKERDVDTVAFVGWSAAAFSMGPYAVKNPTRVNSLFLLAPIFPPDATSTPLGPLPLPGLPMFLTTRWGVESGWNTELRSPDQREPGMVERVWAAIMENDPEGRTWGPPEGLSRVRNFVRWGWNRTTAAQGGVLGGSVPVLIVYGDADATVNTSPPSTNPELNVSVPALYDAVAGSHKLMVRLADAGHSLVWEVQHKNVHNLSKHWLKHLKVDGKTQGVFDMAVNGDLSPVS
ncbi:alpha/beta fold hydrolase [Streptomyces sp. NPDC012508]|uniref:alpha/beta fold hydrolase n=1 Tax=Streptomyces sp. NPDC012508 TaxID=3364837 RepID=UPI00368DA7F1